MNILIPDSWLRDYIDTKACPEDVGKILSLHSFSVEKIHKHKDGDFIYEIEVTPNRGDGLSVLGIARELLSCLPRHGFDVVWKQKPAHKPEFKNIDKLNVVINDPSLVPRFCAVVISDIKNIKSSKLIEARLEKVGVRAINATVDMTNYLMYELGQPMHVFDYDKIIDHKMVVRESCEGEELVTLDGIKRILPAGVIVIEDGSGRLIDLCGIMGCSNSEVDENTKKILFFVQVYNPVKIRKSSMSLGHRTDAALRFEKGVDIQGVMPGLYAGVNMLVNEMEATVTSEIIDIVNTELNAKRLFIDYLKINSIAGYNFEQTFVDSTLTSLGFIIDAGFACVPSWRYDDIEITEDLAEEVIRIFGYYNLTGKLLTGEIPNTKTDSVFFWEDKIRDYLKYMGFVECYTNSTVSKELAGIDAIAVSNPLNIESTYLRTSLIPQLLEVVKRNMGNKEGKLKVFELSAVYNKNSDGELPLQPYTLAIVAHGVDYLDFKGIIQGLLQEIGVTGYDFDIKASGADLVFEVALDALLQDATLKKAYNPIPKYNSILEDLTLIVPAGVLYGNIEEKIKSVNNRIKKLTYKDYYEDSLTISLEYLDNERQLTSEDVQLIRKNVF